MSSSSLMVQPGMAVYGCDAERVGKVRTVQGDRILVEGPKGVNLAIPRTVVQEVSEVEHRVDLTIPAAQAADFRAEGMV